MNCVVVNEIERSLRMLLQKRLKFSLCNSHSDWLILLTQTVQPVSRIRRVSNLFISQEKRYEL